MSGEQSEEKSFAATAQKLRKAREKGQVAHPKDLAIFAVALAGFGFLLANAQVFEREARVLLDVSFAALSGNPSEGVTAIAVAGAQLGAAIVLPMTGLVIVAGIGAGMLGTGGPIFATEPLVPDPNKLNPAEGFKRLFGVKALVGFLFSLGKLALLAAVLGVALRDAIGAFAAAPEAGSGALGPAFLAVATDLAVRLVAIIGGFAILDFLIERALFLREMRMTRTELKQERKEQDGDPHIRGRRRQIARAAVDQVVGVGRATFALRWGDAVVALRFREGEQIVPVVVAKRRGDGAARLLRELPLEAAIIDDPEANELRRISLGDPVTGERLDRLVTIMRRNQLI